MWMGRNGMWYRLQGTTLQSRNGKQPMEVDSYMNNANERREQQLRDYEACSHVSPRRFSNCLDEQQNMRDENSMIDS